MIAVPPTNLCLADGTVLRAECGFCMGRFAVTFDEFDAYCRAQAVRLPDDEGWGRGMAPVIHVNRDDAQAYCRFLSEKAGRRYRLPTAVEWELAARAGSLSRFWWGEDLERGDANYMDTPGYGTFPVHSLAPNAWGLYGVVGNVAEWTLERDASAGQAQSSGDAGIVRGGHWATEASVLSTDLVEQVPAERRSNRIGFRVAADL